MSGPVSDMGARFKADPGLTAQLAVHLLGEPNRALSNRKELRWGEHGRRWLCLSGAKAGQWFDHASGEGGDALDLIRAEMGGDLTSAAEYAARWLGDPARAQRPVRPPAEPADEPSDADRTRQALRLWQGSTALRGSRAEAYLTFRCGSVPGDLYEADALRFHGACPFTVTTPEGARTIRLPAMIGLMRNVVTGEPQAVHRTALKADGSDKAIMPDGSNPKKMLGPAGGAAVMLTAPENVTMGLGLAEGIETSVSVLLTGFRPVWAAGSSGAIGAFPVLAGIDCLTVFADHDAKGQGEAAATEVCQRYADAGAEGRWLAPPAVGDDWNDALTGKAA